MLMYSDAEKTVMNFLAVLKIPVATLKIAKAKRRAEKDQHQLQADRASDCQGTDGLENCPGQGHAVDLEICEGQGHKNSSVHLNKSITEESSEEKKISNPPIPVPELVTPAHKQMKSHNTRKRKLSGTKSRQTKEQGPETPQTTSAVHTFSDSPVSQITPVVQTLTDSHAQFSAGDPTEEKVVKPTDNEAASLQNKLNMHDAQPKSKELDSPAEISDGKRKQEQESANKNYLDTQNIVKPVVCSEPLASVAKRSQTNNRKETAVKDPATSSGKNVKLDRNRTKQKVKTTRKEKKMNAVSVTTTKDHQNFDSEEKQDPAANTFSSMSLRTQTKQEPADSGPRRKLKTPKLSQRTGSQRTGKKGVARQQTSGKTQQNSVHQCPHT